MHKDDKIRLRHMLDAAREARSFIQEQSRKDLDLSRMLVLALVKDIEIVGEAAARVSEDVQRSHPDIPWSDIVGMRHRLIHAYFEINLDILWQTVVTDLPPLIVSLEKVLPAEAG